MAKIERINICGLSERTRLCLDKYINEQKAALVFLSETKTSIFDHHFHNYNFIGRVNQHNPNQKGGVGILSHQDFILDRQPQLEKDDIDAIFAAVTVGRARLLICSAYVAPNSQQKLRQFLSLVENAQNELDRIKC